MTESTFFVDVSEQGDLGGVWPIHDGARLSGLKRFLLMSRTIRTSVQFAMTAEMKFGRLRIANGPAAVVRQERLDCLSLIFWSFGVAFHPVL
jgi:hypothetical protein